MAENLWPSDFEDATSQRKSGEKKTRQERSKEQSIAEIKKHSLYHKSGETHTKASAKKAAYRKTLAERSSPETSVFDRAIEVIGDKDEAMRWMGTPVRALDYATPVSLLGNSKGRRTVLTVLGRLEHGVL